MPRVNPAFLDPRFRQDDLDPWSGTGGNPGVSDDRGYVPPGGRVPMGWGNPDGSGRLPGSGPPGMGPDPYKPPEGGDPRMWGGADPRAGGGGGGYGPPAGGFGGAGRGMMGMSPGKQGAMQLLSKMDPAELNALRQQIVQMAQSGDRGGIMNLIQGIKQKYGAPGGAPGSGGIYGGEMGPPQPGPEDPLSTSNYDPNGGGSPYLGPPGGKGGLMGPPVRGPEDQPPIKPPTPDGPPETVNETRPGSKRARGMRPTIGPGLQAGPGTKPTNPNAGKGWKKKKQQSGGGIGSAYE